MNIPCPCEVKLPDLDGETLAGRLKLFMAVFSIALATNLIVGSDMFSSLTLQGRTDLLNSKLERAGTNMFVRSLLAYAFPRVGARVCVCVCVCVFLCARENVCVCLCVCVPSESTMWVPMSLLKASIICQPSRLDFGRHAHHGHRGLVKSL